MRFGAIYGMGAAMGFTPHEVGQMSMWQFFSAVEGYHKANSVDDGSLSQSEQDELWEMVKQRMN
jgi:hypothetical protein